MSQVLGHVQCLILVKNRSQYHAPVEKLLNYEYGDSHKVKEKFNEKTSFKEKKM